MAVACPALGSILENRNIRLLQIRSNGQFPGGDGPDPERDERTPANERSPGGDGPDPVGSDPPAGLLPTCGTEVDRMSVQEFKDKPELRRRLKVIYWFYNDPRLGIFKVRNLMDFLLEEP
ncbi:amylopullulanase [Striga asiatica]|uniref:Amylopullulanase n=1 Tax=Striga asiatica TaxID=4170 RepID=A0A5A7R1E0_STRAF|nr:amylopullulanase [Striga asiatica]